MPLFKPQPHFLLDPPIRLPELQLTITMLSIINKKINSGRSFFMGLFIIKLNYFV